MNEKVEKPDMTVVDTSRVETDTPRPHAFPGGWRASEAADLAGISYRQIDYWTREGILTPSVANPRGSGTSRRYSASDIEVLAVLRELSGLGVNLTHFLFLSREIRAVIEQDHPWLVVARSGRATGCSREEVLEVAAGGGMSAWLVDIPQVLQTLRPSLTVHAAETPLRTV